MPFNVILDGFFPVVNRDGSRRWLAFHELATADDAVDFDWQRADFNLAALEFAVGIAALAFQPLKPSDWERLWETPPGAEETAARIAPFAHAFALDGEGPRFLQERGGLEGEPSPVEALLIDTPGVNGQKKNADVLTHRGRYPVFGLPAAAMALYTLQQFAPSGGAGHRTSMRGGGPLSTFVLPGGRERPSLWRTILANLPQSPDLEFEQDELPRIMPWLTPTLISDKAHGERVVSQKDPDTHLMQAFFGMPRRIALQFAADGVCAMTGQNGPVVDGFAQKPWGVNYGPWSHPLTPYRQQKEGAEPYSVKPKSARFGYRDWTPIVVGETQGVLAHPAQNVALARGHRRTLLRSADGVDASLRAAGWAMNNMEAVAYLSAEQPLHLAASEEAQYALESAAKRFAQAAEGAVSILMQALKAALFSEGAKPSTDKALFEQARSAFYEASDDAFHDLLNTYAETPLKTGDESARKWLAHLRCAAFGAFDAAAPISLDDPERAGRIANSFKNLSAGLAGFGKSGRVLFDALELPPREVDAGKRGKRSGL